MSSQYISEKRNEGADAQKPNTEKVLETAYALYSKYAGLDITTSKIAENAGLKYSTGNLERVAAVLKESGFKKIKDNWNRESWTPYRTPISLSEMAGREVHIY